MNKQKNNLNNNPMYEYLWNHGYISENKKSNRQFELSVQRAECIANKYNSLIQQNQENLIKYLEGLLTGNKTTDMFIVTGVQDLLERIKNNNYE